MHTAFARLLFQLALTWLFCNLLTSVYAQTNPAQLYEQVQQRLASGWNTWNTQSVLSHVLLPEGFALTLHLKDTRITGQRYLGDAYISQKEKRPETITPGPHAYNGSYTQLTLEWNGTRIRVESATEGEDLVLLITPLATPARIPHLIVESGMLWNRKGNIQEQQGVITAQTGSRTITVGSPNQTISESIAASAPYLAFDLRKTVGLYTGKRRSIDGIKSILAKQKAAYEAQANRYDTLVETYRAIQGCLAWNTIYDPTHNRVISPVSRFWNTFFGGNYVLFCWDTYFAAYLAALDNKDLAYANAVEVTKAVRTMGMVPNYTADNALGSPDRSQPPIGSLIMREIYRKYGEKWLLEYVFDDLLTWNRWWSKHRETQGLLCWGSDSLPPPYNDDASNDWQGAAYESGLDNAPMYDGVPFNKTTHQMELADVGLNSLYIADCQALAQMAQVLGRKAEAAELTGRANTYSRKLQTLWDKDKGIYLNLRTDTGQKSHRISPTNFYPMLAKLPTQAQAEQLMKKHYFNPEEFYGEWVMPSAPRNDPAFKEQDYWRGRIWGPLNMLVYLGMRHYNLPEARQDLVKKSNELLLRTYRKTGMVHENYNAITGNGIDPGDPLNRSDSFYHWGGLLGLIAFIEAGHLGQPELPIAPEKSAK